MKILTTLLVLLTISAAVPAQQGSLQELVDRAAKTTLERFADKKLQDSELSITLIDLRDAQRPATASFRGKDGAH